MTYTCQYCGGEGVFYKNTASGPHYLKCNKCGRSTYASSIKLIIEAWKRGDYDWGRDAILTESEEIYMAIRKCPMGCCCEDCLDPCELPSRYRDALEREGGKSWFIEALGDMDKKRDA